MAFRQPLIYKHTYNTERGLPEPMLGVPVYGLQCPNCNSRSFRQSAHPDNPTEIFNSELVRCTNCGRISDYYEAYQQAINHAGEPVLVVLEVKP